MIAYLQRLGTDIKAETARIKIVLMLKYIKHHVDTISGVEIYPIISL